MLSTQANGYKLIKESLVLNKSCVKDLKKPSAQYINASGVWKITQIQNRKFLKKKLTF